MKNFINYFKSNAPFRAKAFDLLVVHPLALNAVYSMSFFGTTMLMQ